MEQFHPAFLPVETEGLREQVRAFLRQTISDRPPAARAQSWMGYDADFSRKLGLRGWLGMTWPKQYGGGEFSPFARYVVIEELLAAGAPVSAHWIADRQSGPLILRYGTEAQKARYLPAICRGESFFCIGMSEPDSGSDLASIRTKVERHGDGWLLNGRKLWTTNAHRSHFMILLGRSSPMTANRQEGTSQFIVDLSLPGVSVRPIRDLSGEEDFNEVLFENVYLEADALVGDEGNGWKQVMAELAFERSGPERFLSSIEILPYMVQKARDSGEPELIEHVGRLVAKLTTLRQMSLSITAQLANGGDPAWAASCVKDIGTGFEQELADAGQQIFDIEPETAGDSPEGQALAYLIQKSPSFSLRGGTREILRGILARGLGLR